MKTVEDRFMDKVFMCPMSGCWLWGESPAGKEYQRNYYAVNRERLDALAKERRLKRK